jgi:hypothetical protein
MKKTEDVRAELKTKILLIRSQVVSIVEGRYDGPIVTGLLLIRRLCDEIFAEILTRNEEGVLRQGASAYSEDPEILGANAVSSRLLRSTPSGEKPGDCSLVSE